MTNAAGEVTQVVLMEVRPERYDELIQDTFSDVRRIGAELDGFLGLDVYGTDDRTRVMLILRWTNRDAWGKAQWDERVQKAVVDRVASAQHAQFKVFKKITDAV